MTRRSIAFVCPLLGTVDRVYSNQQPPPPEVKSTISKLVGKTIAVQWAGNRVYIIRSINSLETINFKSAAEFWTEVEDQQKGK